MVDIIKYQGFDHLWQYSGPWLYYLLALYISLPVLAYKVLPLLFHTRRNRSRKTILIFVMGDLGHSPRMCYHALSFSKLEYNVSLCGYIESQPNYEIIDDVNIDLRPITVVKNEKDSPFLLFAMRKILVQIQDISKILWSHREDADYVMIQNPPSIPILLVVILFKLFISRHLKIIIDWHNLNYTILNLRYNNLHHPLVRITKAYEQVLARFASLNITVTKKMKSFLVDEFALEKSKIVTLYDRPGKQFQPLNEVKESGLYRKHEIFNEIKGIENYKVLVSSTSFTPDEDFTILLEALKSYEQESNTPPLLLIITGKGPLKNEFLNKVQDFKFSEKVVIKTAWLSSENYPKILASADLGVSLHTSSSGIDLPMKIVDFFGCGIPVVSLDFPAIGELVKEGKNGVIVKTSKELGKAISNIFTNETSFRQLKAGAMEESRYRWDENWTLTLRPRFEVQ